MFKKAIPFVLVSGLVLTACGDAGNNGNGNGNDVPGNNETPMENLDNGLNDTTPRVNNGAGPDMDGIDNGLEGNGVNNGIINDGNRNNGDMNGDNTTSPNDDILTDDNDTNRNRNNNR